MLNLAIAFYNVGMIWLAQLNWILWGHVGAAAIADYRLAWWHGILWAIFPVATLGVIGVAAQLVWSPPVPRWMLWAALGLQIGINVGTVLWWGPTNADISVFSPTGRLTPEYLTLVDTHWIRVGLFSLAGLLQLWITVACLTPTIANEAGTPGTRDDATSSAGNWSPLRRGGLIVASGPFLVLFMICLFQGLWTLSVVVSVPVLAVLAIATTGKRAVP